MQDSTHAKSVRMRDTRVSTMLSRNTAALHSAREDSLFHRQFLDDWKLSFVLLCKPLGFWQRRVFLERISPEGFEHAIRVEANHVKQPTIAHHEQGVNLQACEERVANSSTIKEEIWQHLPTQSSMQEVCTMPHTCLEKRGGLVLEGPHETSSEAYGRPVVPQFLQSKVKDRRKT